MKIKNKTFLLVIIILDIVVAVIFRQFFYKDKLSYNNVLNTKIENSNEYDYYLSEYEDKTINWQGKISNYYTQISGIKFCIIDDEHKEIDVNKSCDWFWAVPEADNNNDESWVTYTLNQYNLQPEKRIYNITGTVQGIDCAVDIKCIPDIRIININ